MIEQVLGNLTLPSVTSSPQGSRQVIAGWCRISRAVRLDAIEQPQRRRFEQRRAGAALEQPTSRLPLTKCSGVCHRGTTGDHRAARLDVGTGIEQRIENRDVVAAGRPVQGCLGVRATEPGIDVGTRSDQRIDGLGAIRKVARPIGGHMQQRAGHAGRAVAGRSQRSRRQFGMI